MGSSKEWKAKKVDCVKLESISVKTVLIALLRFYKVVLSPLFPPSCRFVPSCSEYASEAIRRHGALRGGSLALRRLLRCHPFQPGGYDPVK